MQIKSNNPNFNSGPNIGSWSEIGGSIPFVFPRDLEQCNFWMKHRKVEILRLRYNSSKESLKQSENFGDDTKRLILLLTVESKDNIMPIDNKTNIRNNNVVTFLISKNRIDEAITWLADNNWIPTS